MAAVLVERSTSMTAFHPFSFLNKLTSAELWLAKVSGDAAVPNLLVGKRLTYSYFLLDLPLGDRIGRKCRSYVWRCCGCMSNFVLLRKFDGGWGVCQSLRCHKLTGDARKP